MNPKLRRDGKNSAARRQDPFVKPGMLSPEIRVTGPTPTGSIGCAATWVAVPSRARCLSSGSTRSPVPEGSGTARMIRSASSSSRGPAPATLARPTDHQPVTAFGSGCRCNLLRSLIGERANQSIFVLDPPRVDPHDAKIVLSDECEQRFTNELVGDAQGTSGGVGPRITEGEASTGIRSAPFSARTL